MHCFALSDTPAPDYVFGTGSGEHPTFRARDTSKRRLPEITHVVVLGEDEHGAERVLPVQVEAGFQRSRVVTRQYLKSNAECSAQALALATKAEAAESQAIIFCLPSFALELWDAVQSDDWQADQVRYVTNLQEIYNTERERSAISDQLSAGMMPLYQVVTLADVDVTLHATGHGLPAPTALTHAYTEDGHRLAWFYPGKLADVLYFELVRNTTDVIDGNETVVYRGQNLQALAEYSDDAGDYFGARALGAGELASYWVWAGPFTARQVTMQDDFSGYIRSDLSNLESLCALELCTMEPDESWTVSGTPDTSHVKEGSQGLKLASGGGCELAVDFDMDEEQRFTDADFVGLAAYASGAIAELSLFFKTSEIQPANFYFAWALSAGWNHLKARRGDAGAASGDWSDINKLTFELSDSGYDATLDHLWISKADPDHPETYNDTGRVWDFLPLQGSGASEWHILKGNKSGMPSHDYVMAQLYAATSPANWLLGWHTLADVSAGVGIAGAWLRDEGQAALAFCIQDASIATRTLYAVEVDTAADVVRLAAWVDGERTQLAEAAFPCAPGEEIWLGADFRDASRINVYASTTQGNLIQGGNLLISKVDTGIERGGAIGLMAYDCVVYFFDVRAGSPRHVDKSEWSALAARALVADEATHAATADALTSSPVFPGVVWEYAGSTAPAGWLLCDGSAVSRTAYAALFDAIGTTFGAGDGSTTFNLPDRRDRFGQGASATDALGATGGVKMQTDVPEHAHGYRARDYNTGANYTRVKVVGSSGTEYILNTDNTGAAGGVDQRPPFVAMNYIIKT